MIKRLLPLLIFLMPIFSSAQTERDSAKFRCHEINVGYINVFHLFGTNYADVYHYDDDFLYLNIYDISRNTSFYYSGMVNFAEHANPSLGVGYKYHFKTMKGLVPTLHAIRLFTDFSVSDFGLNGKSSMQFDSLMTDINKFQKVVIKAGYQSEKSYKRIVYYFGFDLLFQHASIDYNLSGINFGCYDEKGKLSVTGYGLSPLLGIRFKINDFFSISTETRLKAAWYTVIRNYAGHDYSINTDFNGNYSSDHFDLRFAPIGLVSLNIHLVKKERLRLN